MDKDKSNFDYPHEFASALFVLAGHGDGKAAWTVRGWQALVAEIALNCINGIDPSDGDRAEAARMLTENDDWEWSYEQVSKPYFWQFPGEAEHLNVYRINESAAVNALDAHRQCVEALREALPLVEEYSCRTPVGHIATDCETVAARIRAALSALEQANGKH